MVTDVLLDILGPVDSSFITPSRIALSVPLVNSFTHPLVPGPVLATHPLDLQDFSGGDISADTAHSGPPTINVEAKLVGVNDDLVEKGADPVGTILIRGPPVGKLLGVEDYISVSSSDENEGWTGLDAKARVKTNGAFQVVEY